MESLTFNLLVVATGLAGGFLWTAYEVEFKRKARWDTKRDVFGRALFFVVGRSMVALLIATAFSLPVWALAAGGLWLYEIFVP